MMDAIEAIKILKQEIHAFSNQGVTILDLARAPSLKKNPSTRYGQIEVFEEANCFSCTMSLLDALLNFVGKTAESRKEEYCQVGLDALLYQENLKMFSPSLVEPAKKALSLLAGRRFLDSIEKTIFEKADFFPAHLLDQNIKGDSSLLLKLLQRGLL